MSKSSSYDNDLPFLVNDSAFFYYVAAFCASDLKSEAKKGGAELEKDDVFAEKDTTFSKTDVADNEKDDTEEQKAKLTIHKANAKME